MKLKNLVAAFAVVAFSITASAAVFAKDFSDVPKEHWAYENIGKLRELKITEGIGDNKFGMGKNITKQEFVTFLERLLKRELAGYAGSNPKDPINREEMAILLVRSLGYEELAKPITKTELADVTENIGYINLAKDFGIIVVGDDNKFNPKALATREQAAAMMIRMVNKLSESVDFLNGFYAIKSASQMNYIENLDSASYGWSRVELGGNEVVLNTTAKNNNEYSIPSGYKEPISLAKNKNALLMVAVNSEKTSGGIPLVEYIVSDQEAANKTIELIVNETKEIPEFDGVVIDFEGMKGDKLKSDFNNFLVTLRSKMKDKLIYVAVHPKPRDGVYFDAYDYQAIGKVADKVILMAHDYHAKNLTPDEMASNFIATPLAPIDQVYYSLKAITDKKTGVQDLNKIAVQLSFDTAQWKIKDGKIINSAAYNPDYDTLYKRMQSGVTMNYSKRYESPFITFENPDDASTNIVWYEDERSVAAKIKLAKMFGIHGVSLWRLGTIPSYQGGGGEFYLNVWNTIKQR